jgi:hypothetical protein
LRFKGVKIGKSATISMGEERMMTLTEKWKMEGWMVGKAEGKIEGKQEVLIKLIQLKFGAVAENLEKVIYECKNLEELDKILTKVALANSIEEINIKLGVIDNNNVIL